MRISDRQEEPVGRWHGPDRYLVTYDTLCGGSLQYDMGLTRLAHRVGGRYTLGTDISGWIQARIPDQYPHDPWGGWAALVRIDRLVERNYGMFGSLFGVRNDYGFPPIASARGMPEDSPPELEQWGEEPEPPWEETPSWITWQEIRAIDWDERGDRPISGEVLGLRRGDVLTPGWSTLLGLMEVLAKQFGDDGVRLVVWFY